MGNKDDVQRFSTGNGQFNMGFACCIITRYEQVQDRVNTERGSMRTEEAAYSEKGEREPENLTREKGRV